MPSWSESGDQPREKISDELLALTQGFVDRELESRRAINEGLRHLITFAGALLALAFALGARIADLDLQEAGRALVGVCFMTAIACLVLVLLVSLRGLRPRERTGVSPAILRHYRDVAVPGFEIRQDLYGAEVDLFGQLQASNSDKARKLLVAQRWLIGAALATAAGASTLSISGL